MSRSSTKWRIVRAKETTGFILVLTMLSLTACHIGGPPALSSVDALGWEDSHYLWASGYVQGITTLVMARYDIRSKGVTWFDFGFDRFLFAQDGTVWALNSYSINHYDGNSWKSFDSSNGLAAGPFWSMIQANNGSIWVGSSGLSRYDLNDERWDLVLSSLPNVCTAPDCAEVEGGAVYALLQDQEDAIWAGTTQGVILLADTSRRSWTVTEGLAHNSVKTLVETEDGTIWAGTANGVSWWDGQLWHVWPNPNEPAPFPGFSVDIQRMIATRDGEIWAATPYSVVQWNGINWHYVKCPCCGDSKITSLLETTNGGHVWISTNGDGVCRWDGQQWHTYTTSQGLSHNLVHTLIQSPDDLLWAGSLGGVDCYDPTTDQWQSLTICQSR